MAISLRMSQEEERLIKKYAEIWGLSVSELIRQAVMEKIEDEIDLELAQKALAEYEANPISYSMEEIKKELGL